MVWICFGLFFFSSTHVLRKLKHNRNMTDAALLSLARITLGRESLLCKHIHTLYTCSHCFIEHLGSISHFKNFRNSTTIVGQGFVCLLDSSSQIGGTLNCWCSVHGYHLWRQGTELAHGYRDVAMWGMVLDNVNVCVRAGGHRGDAQICSPSTLTN